jgi:hypothetical protein
MTRLLSTSPQRYAVHERARARHATPPSRQRQSRCGVRGAGCGVRGAGCGGIPGKYGQTAESLNERAIFCLDNGVHFTPYPPQRNWPWENRVTVVAALGGRAMPISGEVACALVLAARLHPIYIPQR